MKPTVLLGVSLVALAWAGGAEAGDLVIGFSMAKRPVLM